MSNDPSKYMGLRALGMTRVSTPRQEEGYGHPSQEQAFRTKLVEPLRLRLVGIVRDTYTGTDFENRRVLDEVLERAKRGEFDLFIMDVLDRLGRKGLERELWRMKLRATGVTLLTTDPADHADDDSSWGELIRMFKGIGSEDELNNIMRRTMNGKRAKAEGRNQDGSLGEKKIVGYGPRLYGYHFKKDEKGKTVGLVLNHDLVYTEPDGIEWTEVKVIEFIFNSVASGTPIRRVAVILNEKGIPTATKNKNIRFKDKGKAC